MKVVAVLAVVASLLAGAAGAARADNPALVADVGANDAFAISLADASGASVTHLDAGTYTLTVHDRSALHNFHLSGPGVDVSTAVEFVGDETFSITLGDGHFFYQCDPHATRMKGDFTVGVVTAPPAPAPAPAAVKLTAVLSPRAVRLTPVAGVSAGKAIVTVADQTAKDGFRLVGPGVARRTGLAYRGTVRWTVTLRAGTYSYGSLRQSRLRRTFTVSR